MQLIIYCADIGSVKGGNFGWARIKNNDDETCRTSTEIQHLAEAISDDLNKGCKVALGFECPLFVPIPDKPEDLTSARPGEGNRAWSAGAGTGSLAIGLTESLWILCKVRALLSDDVKSIVQVYLDWDKFQAAGSGLFIWEAFITGEAKSDSHHGDADVAVKSFAKGLPTIERHNAIRMGEVKVRSLIGAALLQAEWTKDLSFLSTPCLVIGANKQIKENSIQSSPRVTDPPAANLSPLSQNCYCCTRQISIVGHRKCPAPGCTKEFTSGSWGGIDAHWKNNHKRIMEYADLYRNLCPAHRNWRRG